MFNRLSDCNLIFIMRKLILFRKSFDFYDTYYKKLILTIYMTKMWEHESIILYFKNL